jgi:hypothetical protein
MQGGMTSDCVPGFWERYGRRGRLAAPSFGRGPPPGGNQRPAQRGVTLRRCARASVCRWARSGPGHSPRPACLFRGEALERAALHGFKWSRNAPRARSEALSTPNRDLRRLKPTATSRIAPVSPLSGANGDQYGRSVSGADRLCRSSPGSRRAGGVGVPPPGLAVRCKRAPPSPDLPPGGVLGPGAPPQLRQLPENHVHERLH